MRKYFPLLKQTALFQGITDAELEAIFSCQAPRFHQYAKQDYLFHMGEYTHAIGIVLEGSVTILTEDFWGNTNILAKLGPGQFFAEVYACIENQPMGVSVMTDEGATVLFWDTRRLLTPCSSACAFHTLLVRNFLSVMAQKNLQLNTKLTHLTQRSTRTKLLSYLSEESLRRNCSAFDIPFTRQQLADYLSVNRSALSKELCKLREEGLLQFHKNHFTLLDKAAVRENASAVQF